MNYINELNVYCYPIIYTIFNSLSQLILFHYYYQHFFKKTPEIHVNAVEMFTIFLPKIVRSGGVQMTETMH